MGLLRPSPKGGKAWSWIILNKGKNRVWCGLTGVILYILPGWSVCRVAAGAGLDAVIVEVLSIAFWFRMPVD